MADEQDKPKNQSSDAVEAARAIEKFIDTTLPSLPPIPEELLQTYNAMNEMGLDPRDPVFMFNAATRYKKNTDHRDEFDITHPDIKLIQAGRTQGKSVPFHKVPRVVMVTTPGTDHIDEMVKSLQKQPWEFVAHIPEEGPLPPVEFNATALEALAITPELLESTEPSFTTSQFMKNWMAAVRQTGKSEMVEDIAQHVIKLITTGKAMGYKKSRVVTAGKMRHKRRHHYTALVEKEYVKSTKKFYGVTPECAGIYPASPDGDLNMTMMFDGFRDPKQLEIKNNLAPRVTMSADGKITLLSVDVVNQSAV